MQQPTASPRTALTSAQVTAIIEGQVQVDYGCELLNDDDVFVADISTDVASGSVDHGNYRTVHGTCRLALSRTILWGSQRLKPYMTLTSLQTGLSLRANLGVYLPVTPDRPAGETPATYDVEGYDKTLILDTPIGSTYRVAAGAGHLASAQALIVSAGESKILVSDLGNDKTLPADRLWPIDEDNTYRKVVNDLLDAVGYRAVWCDQDGYYRFDPYQAASVRAPEWTYSTAAALTIVGEDRQETTDFFETPNRWVFIRDDPELGAPTEGAGIYTVVNQSDGLTSIDQRGRTIIRVMHLDAADQASLVAQGDRISAENRQVNRAFTFTVGPNPLHLHFDVVTLTDADLDVNGKVQVSSWSLPFDGSDMSIEARLV